MAIFGFSALEIKAKPAGLSSADPLAEN